LYQNSVPLFQQPVALYDQYSPFFSPLPQVINIS
jgi:hypothetical protein